MPAYVGVFTKFYISLIVKAILHSSLPRIPNSAKRRRPLVDLRNYLTPQDICDDRRLCLGILTYIGEFFSNITE